MPEITDAITAAELEEWWQDSEQGYGYLSHSNCKRLIAAYRESQAEVRRLREELTAMGKFAMRGTGRPYDDPPITPSPAG